MRKTAKLVADKLRSLRIEVKTRAGGTGVLGILRGSGNGYRWLHLGRTWTLYPWKSYRMDFRSEVKAVTHACGHETHVAILLGGGPSSRKPGETS